MVLPINIGIMAVRTDHFKLRAITAGSAGVVSESKRP